MKMIMIPDKHHHTAKGIKLTIPRSGVIVHTAGIVMKIFGPKTDIIQLMEVMFPRILDFSIWTPGAPIVDHLGVEYELLDGVLDDTWILKVSYPARSHTNLTERFMFMRNAWVDITGDCMLESSGVRFHLKKDYENGSTK